MKDINRAAVKIVRVVEGRAIARRRNPETEVREYLFEWFGSQGERHEAWYPESEIKLED
jgi:hypothetical protein